MHRTLKFKITVAAFIILTVIMSLSAWKDIKQIEQIVLDSQKEKAILFAERIEHGLMVLMLKNQWRELPRMLEGIANESEELEEIRILTPENGMVAASSKQQEVGTRIYGQEINGFTSTNMDGAFLINKKDHRYASKYTVIKNKPMCYGCHGSQKTNLGILDIKLSLLKVKNSIDEIKMGHLYDTFIGFFLIGGGFLLVVGILIDKPIKNIIATIRKIENGDTSVRMKEDQNDEFGLVAKSFNGMLNTLESAKHEIESFHVEQMQKAAKLASLGEIISGIAHEIKNPLTGISCAVQVFQSELEVNDTRRQITTEILNHIKRLDSTVKSLLNYAKPKPPQFLAHQVEDVLNKAIFFVYPEAKKQRVVIDTDIHNNLAAVMMDPDQIQQVFLNLMINALQAMPEGGKLKITISNSEKEIVKESDDIASQLLAENYITVKFQDTGIGIGREYLQSIFDPFFTKKSKGTGLGLSISQRIVQEHGGEVTVKSDIDRGSTFTVYLPQMNHSAHESAECTNNNEHTGGLTIRGQSISN